MFPRLLEDELKARFNKGKAVVLLGPRQVGKTTLIRECLKGRDFLFLDGDDPDVRRTLEGVGFTRLQQIIGTAKWVFIDEAQRIEDVGLIAKMLVDRLAEVQLIISGSSALEINQTTAEPLTGRKFEYLLYPISWQEFEAHLGWMEAEAQLEERLIWGMYPDVLQNPGDAQEILRQLTSAYLYRDVLALTGIRKPELLEKLVQALALQVGSEVSYNELAQLLDIDKATVAKYIDLLEKAFIVFKLNSFSRNPRNEIKNNRKVYFWDNGIRNMVINNLNPLNLRTDKGALWENFLIVERMKSQAYNRTAASHFFWRTPRQQEIDFVEDSAGILKGYEFKWKARGNYKAPKAFTETYNATVEVIDRQNFRDFL
jgi:predicted AAA+ superfamily ATPase